MRASELGLARNTVKRYLRGGEPAEKQVRPTARALDEEGQRVAVELFDGEAEGNAVVVTELLQARGYDVAERTVQEVVATRRREQMAATVATVRYETAPGAQMRIDFGQGLVWIAGGVVRVYLLVAVLSYSRRIFVKAFLAKRQDAWLDGSRSRSVSSVASPRTLLGDNARPRVLAHNRVARTVTFHSALPRVLPALGRGGKPRVSGRERGRARSTRSRVPRPRSRLSVMVTCSAP